jgi:hypothetical protein
VANQIKTVGVERLYLYIMCSINNQVDKPFLEFGSCSSREGCKALHERIEEWQLVRPWYIQYPISEFGDTIIFIQ